MENLLNQALSMVNMAIFRRQQNAQYFLVYASQPWFERCIPNAKINSYLTLAGTSHFLDDFLLDADEFWQQGSDKLLQSEVWKENLHTATMTLQAVAYVKDGNEFLIIKDAALEYQNRQDTLQTARESMIEHQQLMDSHFSAQNRLENMLTQAESQTQQSLQLLEALDHADLGVIVTDNKQGILLQNPASFQLFSIEKSSLDNSPLSQLKRILGHQLPEYTNLLSSGRRWDGELYYTDATNNEKWFQATLFTIKNQYGETAFIVYLITDITRLKHLVKLNETLYQQDILTELPNRQSLFAYISQQMANNIPLKLTCINIKRFSLFNKHHGYTKGDQILNSFASWLSSNFSQAKYIARIGGDEFALIDCPVSGNDILTLNQNTKWQIDNQSVDLMLSIAEVESPIYGRDINELMKNLDLAMHLSRPCFESKFKLFDEQVKASAELTLIIEKNLPMALENDEFELYLQPIIDVVSGEVIQAEALIRWNHPKHGMISPEDFISIAEQTGAIIPIGNWVITKTCEYAKRFNDLDKKIKISFNVSPIQLASNDLLQHLQYEVSRHELQRGQLEVEITENIMVSNIDQYQHLFKHCKELGISIAIDDFGTGYSSLSYLTKFPVDKLKVDRCFIAKVLENHTNKTIVEAVISLANSLNIDIVAEGIETQDQSDFLADKNCTSLQGYYYSRPLPYQTFCQFILSNNAG
ncbi:putative bifunctional diguanylate cyclase/phosphodiesterase [Algibacillus agarilyticus]|uniref:putative bifunctional diguanylate cyclase/phosphodiesterase n=1 Tax=Algibacillus agarilyticus TaxID=2234133 RepID=UPI000DD00DEF|nr:EAL domain-containing protein [Algibacillus agarilyticus]